MKKKKNKKIPAARPRGRLSWPLPAGLPDSFRVRVCNESNGAFLDLVLEQANTSISRLRGLMFRKKPASILFTFDWPGLHGIHSFFVSFPFDAVYLDEAGKVVDVFEQVPPFTHYLAPRKPVRYLIELPAGQAGRLHLKPNDSVSLYQYR